MQQQEVLCIGLDMTLSSRLTEKTVEMPDPSADLNELRKMAKDG